MKLPVANSPYPGFTRLNASTIQMPLAVTTPQASHSIAVSCPPPWARNRGTMANAFTFLSLSNGTGGVFLTKKPRTLVGLSCAGPIQTGQTGGKGGDSLWSALEGTLEGEVKKKFHTEGFGIRERETSRLSSLSGRARSNVEVKVGETVILVQGGCDVEYNFSPSGELNGLFGTLARECPVNTEEGTFVLAAGQRVRFSAHGLPFSNGVLARAVEVGLDSGDLRLEPGDEVGFEISVGRLSSVVLATDRDFSFHGRDLRCRGGEENRVQLKDKKLVEFTLAKPAPFAVFSSAAMTIDAEAGDILTCNAQGGMTAIRRASSSDWPNRWNFSFGGQRCVVSSIACFSEVVLLILGEPILLSLGGLALDLKPNDTLSLHYDGNLNYLATSHQQSMTIRGRKGLKWVVGFRANYLTERASVSFRKVDSRSRPQYGVLLEPFEISDEQIFFPKGTPIEFFESGGYQLNPEKGSGAKIYGEDFHGHATFNADHELVESF